MDYSWSPDGTWGSGSGYWAGDTWALPGGIKTGIKNPVPKVEHVLVMTNEEGVTVNFYIGENNTVIVDADAFVELMRMAGFK